MPANRFEQDVIEGLSARMPWLPCKYLYDARGSELFEKICETDDYYVTRADLEIHTDKINEIASLIGKDAHVIELGSGAGIKTQLLLEALHKPRAYTPIEISKTALDDSVSQLKHRFPQLDILPVQADYTQQIDSAHLRLEPAARRRVIYFPGSTIGNFTHSEALEFLMRMGRMAGTGGLVLVGVDLIKPISRLIQAYDDDQGITADFNKNLLIRMQDELDAEVDLDAFSHEARFNTELSRIEMHLVATKATKIQIANRTFEFSKGESIHTESSHKYSVAGFQSMAKKAGLTPIQFWLDDQARFSMHCLTPQPS